MVILGAGLPARRIHGAIAAFRGAIADGCSRPLAYRRAGIRTWVLRCGRSASFAQDDTSLFQRAQARGEHFAECRGVLAQQLLCESFARSGAFGGRGIAHAEVCLVERGKLRGLRARLLRRLPKLMGFPAPLRIVHGLRQPFRRRLVARDW